MAHPTTSTYPPQQQRQYLTRKALLCLLWSGVFFFLISGICLIVIAVRTTVSPSAAGSVADEIILGSKLARAVIALQDNNIIFLGVMVWLLVKFSARM